MILLVSRPGIRSIQYSLVLRSILAITPQSSFFRTDNKFYAPVPKLSMIVCFRKPFLRSLFSLEIEVVSLEG